MTFNQQINKITPILTNGKYIYFALRSPYFQKKVVHESVGGATPIINQSRWSNLVVPLPPSNEQKRIVERVDEILELIDRLDKEYKLEESSRFRLTTSSLKSLLHGDNLALNYLSEIVKTQSDIKELDKSVLALAVSGQLFTQDSSEGTGQDLYEQIHTEKAKLIREGKIKKQKNLPSITSKETPFEIPSSWMWVRVHDISHDLGQKKPDSVFTYIDVASINNETAKLESPQFISEYVSAPSRARKIVKKGTVIYSTVRPYLLNIALIEDDISPEPIASTAFAVLFPYNGVLSDYLLHALRSEYFTEFVNSNSVGAAYPAINDASFSKGLVPLPPQAEQARIVEKINQIFDLTSTLRSKIKN